MRSIFFGYGAINRLQNLRENERLEISGDTTEIQ